MCSGFGARGHTAEAASFRMSQGKFKVQGLGSCFGLRSVEAFLISGRQRPLQSTTISMITVSGSLQSALLDHGG